MSEVCAVPARAGAVRRAGLVALGTLVVAGTAIGAATASAATGGGTFGASKDAKIAAKVPAAIRSKGSLTVATDGAYPPNEFVAPDGRTIVGMDVDLGHALGAVMGLKLNFQKAIFDNIIPGLQSGRYGLGMSSFTDTRDREKVVDFVTYYSAGSSFFTRTGGPKVTGLADLCGKTVGAQRGTTQAADATAQDKKCKAAGKSGVQLSVFTDQNGVNLALSSNRIQVGAGDSPVVAYAVKQSKGRFVLSGKPYGPYPYGIAVPKKSGMAVPIRDALRVLIAKGVYAKIMKTWNVQQGAIKKPLINAPKS